VCMYSMYVHIYTYIYVHITVPSHRIESLGMPFSQWLLQVFFLRSFV